MRGPPRWLLAKAQCSGFSRGLQEDLGQERAAGIQAGAGPLLNEIHMENKKNALERVDQYKGSFGLSIISDGVTVNRIAMQCRC